MYENQGHDMASTFLKELINKPAFKDDLRAVLKSMDGPETGRELVRTFLWQDLEFSLGLMGGLPAIANALIRIFDEILVQMDDKFSPELLRGFIASLLDDIDTATLGQAIKRLRPILDIVSPLFGDLVKAVEKEGAKP
ncbi:MAG: hypothetical protein ABFD81_06795 [Syntrophaceae bacterium]